MNVCKSPRSRRAGHLRLQHSVCISFACDWPSLVWFWTHIRPLFKIISSLLPQVPKLPTEKGNEESSEKVTRSINDPHAAKAGAGCMPLRTVMNRDSRPVLIGKSKFAVETCLKAVGKNVSKSVPKSKLAFRVKDYPTPVIGPSPINNTTTNIATKTEDTLLE